MTVVPVQPRIGTTHLVHPKTSSFVTVKVKGKVFPYSLPSVGPGADPGVQALQAGVQAGDVK